MEDKEHIYDSKISPLVSKLIKECKDNELPLFLTVQYSDTDFCTTHIPTNDAHCVFQMMNIFRQCIEEGGVNIDKFLLNAVKVFPNKSSMMLNQLGFKTQP